MAARASNSRGAAWLAGLVVLLSISSAPAAARFAVAGSVTGGGGVSAADGLAVRGAITLVEHVAKSSNARFAVAGGGGNYFLAIRIPGTPPLRLEVVRASGTLFFSWPVTAADYRLESSAELGAGAVWQAVPAAAQLSGVYRYLLLAPDNGHRFYRLRREGGTP